MSAGEWVPHAARYGLGRRRQPDLPRTVGGGRSSCAGGLDARRPAGPRQRGHARFPLRGRPHHAMPGPRVRLLLRQRRGARHHGAAARGTAKVAYVDIDAHHGDGVQFAFYDDPRRAHHLQPRARRPALSRARASWRRWARARALGIRSTCRSSPIPTTRSTTPAFEAVVPPLLDAFEPDARGLQLGIDSHRTDPLTHLALDGAGLHEHRDAPARAVAPRGGARRRGLRPDQCRAGVDGGVGRHQPRRAGRAEIPRACHKELAAHGLKSMRLWDAPLELPADTRQWAEDYAMQQVRLIREHIFPIHGL